jgi:tape measure domain-containing protein
MLNERFANLERNADIDDSSLIQMRGQIDLANNATKSLNTSMQLIADSIEDLDEKQDKFNKTVRNGKGHMSGIVGEVRKLVAAYASIQTVKKVIDLSDEMTATTARLNLMNDGLQTTEQLQNMIYESAQRSRGSYQATAATVAKLGITAKDAFANNEEMIAFAEQMNKQFIIGGASIQEQSNAMYQLTQAMAAGKLQGDEFRSIMENAPMLAQAIADRMGKTTGELKEMSSQGLITANIIKDALFAAADETNARFESMPYTWAQVWQGASNALLMAFQPVLQWIGAAAGWIKENWETVAPIFYGVAAGAIALAIGLGIQAAATWIATGAAQVFFATLLANPLTYIAITIGLVIMAISKWVQSVGGLRIAWLIVVNALLTAWDWVKIGFFTGVYFVLDLWDKMALGMEKAGTAIANFMGDMKANVLMILQSMVNSSINIINAFISTLNKIPGVNIGLIGQVTFGATAWLENEAAKQARNAALADYEAEINAGIANREASLNVMKSDAEAATAERLAGISAAQAANAAQESANSGFDYEAMLTDTAMNTGDTAANTSEANDFAEESVKLWRDIAERDTINRFTTAEVSVEVGGVTNNVNSDVDLDGIIDYLATGLEEALIVTAEGVHE